MQPNIQGIISFPKSKVLRYVRSVGLTDLRFVKIYCGFYDNFILLSTRFQKSGNDKNFFNYSYRFNGLSSIDIHYGDQKPA